MQEEIISKKKAIARTIGNFFTAVFQGELLMRLKVGKYFADILIVFAMIVASIGISLMIDTTLAKIPKNQAILQQQKLEITICTYELERLGRRSTVEALLKEMGSSVGEPTGQVTAL